MNMFEDVLMQESALIGLYEFSHDYNELKRQMYRESLALGLIGAGSLVMVIGFKQTLKLMLTMIDYLAKIIRFGIDKFKELWDMFKSKFIYTNADNDRLADMASKISNKRDLYVITEAEIYLKGHFMNTDVLSVANNLVYTNRRLYENVFLNLIMDGKDVFKTKDDVLSKIAENRAQLLDNKSFDPKASLAEFRRIFRNNVFKFGSSSRYVYTLDDAIKILRRHQTVSDQLNSLKNSIVSQGEQDLKMLEQKKKELSRSSEEDIKITKEFNKQMGYLIQYRKQCLDDTIIAFTVLLDYANSTNRLARMICAKALESPKEG